VLKAGMNIQNFKYMKTLSKMIFYLLLCTVIFCGACSRGEELKNTNKFEKYDIVIIDSCEYIQWGVSYGYLNITHKGNCKFCAERSKK
jgi:hypothetical protein